MQSRVALGIEYDGFYFHKDKELKDREKNTGLIHNFFWLNLLDRKTVSYTHLTLPTKRIV